MWKSHSLNAFGSRIGVGRRVGGDGVCSLEARSDCERANRPGVRIDRSGSSVKVRGSVAVKSASSRGRSDGRV